MDNTFQALECDTDILMIGKDTFTVERFKELVVEKVKTSFNKLPIIHKADRNFNQDIHGFSLFAALSNMNNIKIVDNSLVELNLKNVQLISPPEGIVCKILKLGNSEWKTGKVRIHIMFRDVLGLSDVGVVKLEFCYDEPPQQESPLDDIRQRENYQQLLNNE
ncbi:MAG: hypothetical protein F6K24_38355 [Okeania sp. SIO2D1]|nr:hypothetical protein [Okeania sp. SIO2D1]